MNESMGQNHTGQNHTPPFANDRHHATEPREPPPFQVRVSVRFLLTSLLASSLLAFCVGRATRLALLQPPVTPPPPFHKETEPLLPVLVSKDCKQIPLSRYISKNFDMTMSASSSSYLVTDRDNAETCTVSEDDSQQDEPKPPAAEHLMVDIRNVDTAFLNSERRLANAMIDVTEEAGLTLLSYHCHGLVPMGVSCVGVLRLNYVSFHTWPEEGVITLDLCAGEIQSILPVLPIIERAFGVPSSHAEEPPEMHWAHKLRGFPPDQTNKLQYSETDLGWYVLGDLAAGSKTEVATVDTDFQRISIFDSVYNEDDEDDDSTAEGDSYEDQHPEFFRSNRVVLLDGWLQSTRLDEAAYHEALVHPALFTHDDPKKVAIVGGGEGAALREVLKHKSVEEALVFEIDQAMVNVSRQYLPEWSDCSDLIGSAPWCIEDSRTQVYYGDAFAWLMNHYSGKELSKDPVDVIVVNLADPESPRPKANEVYGDKAKFQALYDALSDDGILVMQLGESPREWHPDESHSKFKNRVTALEHLVDVGFDSIHLYEESHCGFHAPWTFVMALKSYEMRSGYYANVAEVELEMHKRSVRTKSGGSPFQYFDGATMISYQIPPRAVETVFCRRTPTPASCLGCHYFNQAQPEVPNASLEVKASGAGKDAGRGVFAKVDIPKGAYIGAKTFVNPVRFMPTTYELVRGLFYEDEPFKRLHIINLYIDGYGFQWRTYGKMQSFVDSGILTFANHGCKGSYNIGEKTDMDEFTADLNVVPDIGDSYPESVFDPVLDRHLTFEEVAVLAKRDIKAGEEILDNYINFVGSDEDWENDISELRGFCSGSGGGTVNEYEGRRRNRERTKENSQ